MEPQTTPTHTKPAQPTHSPLRTVTPFSKYFALALFIALPFIGGYVGYVYAPEKVVEVERVVVKKVLEEERATVTETRDTEVEQTSSVSGQYTLYQNSDLGIEFEYPSLWIVSEYMDDSGTPSYTGKRIVVSSSDNTQIAVSVMEVSKLGSASDSTEEILQGENSSGKSSIENPVAITIAGVNGVTYTESAESSSFKMAKFENQGLAYYISMRMNESGIQSTEEIDVFNNLIQTFEVEK